MSLGDAATIGVFTGKAATILQWIGLGGNLQETPIFNGKKPWFPVNFPLNQSIEYLPSGYVKIAIEHGPVEIFDLPIQHGGFP